MESSSCKILYKNGMNVYMHFNFCFYTCVLSLVNTFCCNCMINYTRDEKRKKNK